MTRTVVATRGELEVVIVEDRRAPELIVFRLLNRGRTVAQSAIPRRSSAHDRKVVANRLLDMGAAAKEAGNE